MEFKEERFNIEKHIRSIGEFNCGADNPLNEFLSTYAKQYDEDKYGNTFLIIDNDIKTDENILAYFTLKASGIQTVNKIGRVEEYNSVPVIEIARIAVSFDLQGKGLGQLIFNDYIKPKIEAVSNLVAVYGVIAFVVSDDEVAKRFYKNLGFTKADNTIQNQIDEKFNNEDCDLYLLSL